MTIPTIAFEGSSHSGLAEAFEPDENNGDEVLLVPLDLGYERVEETSVRKSGNETDLVAGRVAEMV